MNNTLKNSRGEHFGRIGASACFNYSNGSKAKVGDMVIAYSNGDFRCASYIVQPELTPFVMGLKGVFIRDGVGEGNSSNWSVEKLKDASEIKHGMNDGNGIVANILHAEQHRLNKQETDLLYSFVTKENIPFENRKYIEQMIDCGVIQVCAHHFVSAKIINKRTGEVIDLLQ